MSLKMTRPGQDANRKSATYHRGSTSHRRNSRVGDDGSLAAGSNVFRRTQDERDQAPGASKLDMAHYLKKLEKELTITPQRMRMSERVSFHKLTRLRLQVDAFIDTLDRGLNRDGEMVPMIPTFVMGWPDGSEKGDYLAVDLGGTNLRVCSVALEGDGKFEITQTKYKLSEEQKQDDGQKLFDFCAECLSSFIQDQYGDNPPTRDNPLPLGFTFSYPCIQERIDHGVLLRWTKGFGAPGVEGKDVVEMFNKSLDKYEVPASCKALINDTTGTLIASNYVDKSTRMGIIFGTGCNAAYMEKCGNIPKIKNLNLADDLDMGINCEWGAFDSMGTHNENAEHGGQALPRTTYDVKVDQQSNKPGQQAFEKMISGHYLGEIFRQIVHEMIDEGVLFLGQNTYKMESAYAFDTAFLSLIEADVTDELLTVTGLFAHFFNIETTISERQFFKRLAQLIGTRSARLSACGIAAIASKMGYVEKGCGVATDGSLYQKYPHFAERISEGLCDVFGEKGKNIVTYHAEDGSGVGAALIACLTEKRKAAGIAAHV